MRLAAAIVGLAGVGFFVVGCLGIGAAVAGEMTATDTVFATLTAGCGLYLGFYGREMWREL